MFLFSIAGISDSPAIILPPLEAGYSLCQTGLWPNLQSIGSRENEVQSNERGRGGRSQGRYPEDKKCVTTQL
jgi:hypothetical protein